MLLKGVRMLGPLVLGFPSSIDRTGVRAGRYVLQSVDGGFFRTTNLYCISKGEVTNGEKLLSPLVITNTHHDAVSHDLVFLL